MRSKVLQRVLDDFDSKSWWYKLRVKIKIELYSIKCLGLSKYLKIKLCKQNLK
jgi:hypothetical protein